MFSAAWSSSCRIETRAIFISYVDDPSKPCFAVQILSWIAGPLLEHRDSRQGLSLQELEEGAAAGRDVAHPIADPVLGDRRQRVTSTGDRVCATDRRAGHRHGQAMRALGKRIQFEYAERPVPDDRARL